MSSGEIPLFNRNATETFDFKHGNKKWFASVALYPDRTPGRLFVSSTRPTTHMAEITEGIAILISKLLERGCRLPEIKESLGGRSLGPVSTALDMIE